MGLERIGILKSKILASLLTSVCHGTLSKNGYGLVIIKKSQRCSVGAKRSKTTKFVGVCLTYKLNTLLSKFNICNIFY